MGDTHRTGIDEGMTDALDRDARMLAMRALDPDDPLTEHAARYRIAEMLVRSKMPSTCAYTWARQNGKAQQSQFVDDLALHLAEFISDKCFKRGTSSELELPILIDGKSVSAWARHMMASRCSTSALRLWTSWQRSASGLDEQSVNPYAENFDEAVLTALSAHGPTLASVERGLDLLGPDQPKVIAGGAVELHRRAAAIRAGFRLPPTRPAAPEARGKLLAALGNDSKAAQTAVLDMLSGHRVPTAVREVLHGWTPEALRVLGSDPRVAKVILTAAATPEPLLPVATLNKVIARVNEIATAAGSPVGSQVTAALRRVVNAWVVARSEWTARERSYREPLERKTRAALEADRVAYADRVAEALNRGATMLGDTPEQIWHRLEAILSAVDETRLAG